MFGVLLGQAHVRGVRSTVENHHGDHLSVLPREVVHIQHLTNLYIETRLLPHLPRAPLLRMLSQVQTPAGNIPLAQTMDIVRATSQHEHAPIMNDQRIRSVRVGPNIEHTLRASSNVLLSRTAVLRADAVADNIKSVLNIYAKLIRKAA